MVKNYIFIFYDFFFFFDLPNDTVVKMKEDKKVNNEKKLPFLGIYL